MQLATIEFARNVLGISDADSTELCENTTNPIIDYLPDQYTGINLGGTLRLGAYDCLLKENTKAFEAYKQTVIKERHRHRYEFNNKYLDRIQNAGMIVSGINPETGLVEIVELKIIHGLLLVNFIQNLVQDRIEHMLYLVNLFTMP